MESKLLGFFFMETQSYQQLQNLSSYNMFTSDQTKGIKEIQLFNLIDFKTKSGMCLRPMQKNPASLSRIFFWFSVWVSF